MRMESCTNGWAAVNVGAQDCGLLETSYWHILPALFLSRDDREVIDHSTDGS